MSLTRLKRLNALEEGLKAGYRAQWKKLLEGVLRWRSSEVMRLKLREVSHLLDHDGLSCLDDWATGEIPAEIRAVAEPWAYDPQDPLYEQWCIELGQALSAYQKRSEIPERPLPSLPSRSSLEQDAAQTRLVFTTLEQHAHLTIDPPRVRAWCHYFEFLTLEEEVQYEIHQAL